MSADGWISVFFPANPADARLKPPETAEVQVALGALLRYFTPFCFVLLRGAIVT